MAIRYYHEFTSQLGRQWIINIHDTSFASTSSTFEAADNGFVLQYGDGASKIIDPVLGSRCEVVVQIAQTDTSLQTLISDIVAAQEGRFFIEIREDTGFGTNLYWAGRILTDLISEPDTWPSEVTLTATDGLASLKDVRFDDDGTLYTGQVRFNDLLGLLINKAGVQVPLYGTGGSDYSLRTVANWWHNDMGSPVTGTDPLARSRINHRTWWDEVNTDETFYLAKPSYDVLKNICQGWFGRVFQSAGRYYFMQVTQHGQNPSAWRDYSLNSDGSIFNTTSGTENREVTIDQSQVARLYLGQERYFPALKEVSSVYEHNGSNNILTNQVDFDYSSAITFPPGGQNIPIDLSVGIPTLVIRGTVEVKVTNNIEFNTSNVVDLNGSPSNEAILKARVSGQEILGSTFYLWQSVQGNNQWNLDSTSRLDIALDLPNVLSDPNGNAVTQITTFQTETPIIPIQNGTFKLFGISPNVQYVSNTGTTYTAVVYGGVDYDTDYVGTATNVVLQYRLREVEIIVKRRGPNGTIPNEETTFSVTNTAADDVQPDLETESILFGQDVGGLPPGVLEVNDGSSWSINTDEWAYNAAGGTSAFNQLLVQEIMDLQSVPTPVREWQVRGVFDFYNTLVLDGVEYAPISASLTAWNDTWSGTYFEVNRDSSLVSDDDPIALPTARQIGGTSSAVNQLGRTVYNSLGGINRIAIMNGTINEGDTVTSIPVQALGEGYWKSGDTLTLFNANTGDSQRFTVSSDTTTGDTSISVNSDTASFDFYPNSPIYVSVLDSISGISTGVGTLQTVTDRGATTTNEIDIPSVQFDTTQTLTPTSGQLGWNADDETLDLGLNGGSVVHKLGETLFFNVKAAEAISKGDVLYASGAVGNSGKIEASKYTANNTIEENRVLGVAAEDISIGDFGFVYFLGSLRGITTDGSDVSETWVDGTILYASPSTAGALTSTQPVAPNQDIPIAFVTNAHATNGSLYIRATQLGYHLEELHDVYAPSPSDGEVLTWSNSNQRWEAGAAGGVTTVAATLDTANTLIWDGENEQGYNDYTTRQFNYARTGNIANVNLYLIISKDEEMGTGELEADLRFFLPNTMAIRDDGLTPRQPIGTAMVSDGRTFMVMRSGAKQMRFYNIDATGEDPLLANDSFMPSTGTGNGYMLLQATYMAETISGTAPTANFSTSTTGLQVTYTSDAEDAYLWVPSADGTLNTGEDLRAQAITITYPSTGTYDTPTLRVANNFGTDSFQDTITLAPAAPVASFTISDATPNVGQIVTFTDTSTNTPTSWSWAISPSTYVFEGGTSATSQNPQVAFLDESTNYTVNLTATNAGGSDSTAFTNNVVSNALEAVHFEYDPYLYGDADNEGTQVPTTYGSPTYNAAGYYSFDGTDDAFYYDYDNGINDATGAIELFIDWDNTQNGVPISWSRDNISSYRGNITLKSSDNTITLFNRKASSADQIRLNWNFSGASGKYHIVINKTASGGSSPDYNYEMYINGVSQGNADSDTGTATTGVWFNDQDGFSPYNITVAGQFTNGVTLPNNEVIGDIYRVAIYEDPLSATRISENYNWLLER